MNKKLTPFIVIGIVVVAVGFIFWSGQQSGNVPDGNDDQTANISNVISNDYFDFGEISMANGKVRKVFQAINKTENGIVIDSAFTSCMCTEVVIKKGDKSYGPFGMPGHGGFLPKINLTLNPGEELEAEVIFDPAAHGPAGIGRINRSGYLNNGQNPLFQFDFEAMVKP